jgi:hypothetical protein
VKIFFDEEVELIPDDAVPEGEMWVFWRTRRDGRAGGGGAADRGDYGAGGGVG